MKYETLTSFVKSLTPEPEAVKMRPRLVKSAGKVDANKPIIIRRRGDKK